MLTIKSRYRGRLLWLVQMDAKPTGKVCSWTTNEARATRFDTLEAERVLEITQRLTPIGKQAELACHQ